LGILSGRDLLSSKYITAEISDSGKRLHYVPIRYTVGDYFLADINGQIYCFKIDGSRQLTYRQTFTRSFRILQYSTDHYKPISAGDNTLLVEVLRENTLPKINYKLFSAMKYLGKREKHQVTQEKFTGHSLQALVQEISTHEEEYQTQAQNMIDYLEHLSVDQIITPVKHISEFLEEELTETDPKFLGDIVSTLQRVDHEHKKVTNTPLTGKLPWFKMLLVISLIVIIGGLGYWLYSSGALSNFSIGGLFGGQSSASEDIMKQYPTPEALKQAIAEGKVQESSLPPDIKREVDAIKLPANPPLSK
jgi:hypothetical protein